MNVPPAHFPARPDIGGERRPVFAKEPELLWFGIIEVLRVEAPVWIRAPDLMASLSETFQSLLAAHPELNPDSAAEHLAIAPSFARRLWAEGRLAGSAAPLASGRRVLTHRLFHFATSESGQPHYLPLLADVGEPVSGPGEAADVRAVLRDCCQRDEAWKRAWHFPLEVEPVEPTAPEAAEWQRVHLVRRERVMLLLAAPSWEAWAVDARTGALRLPTPVLRLSGGEQATELFGVALTAPTTEGWREAWTHWARAHGLAKPEADACGLHYERGALRVVSKMPPERWRSFHHGREEWLQAGQGAWRCLARLELPA